jgi:hypothetical protein
MRKGLFTAILMLLVVGAPGPAATPDKTLGEASGHLGVEWVEVAGNPALIPGSCLSWRCGGVSDPAIARMPDGSLKIWFTAIGIELSWTGLKSVGPVVGTAMSDTSLSKVEVSPESAIISVGTEGAWDRYVETPTVRRSTTGSGWTMWYAGYAARGEAADPFIGIALGQAVSSDPEGKAWQRSAAPIYRASAGAWDGRLVTGPTVVRGPDGIWRLYYSGAGTKEGIGLLMSTDGLHWTPYAGNPVLEAEPGAWDEQILEQAVAYVDGRYWLWYSGYRNPLASATPIAIGVATSGDGIHWTPYAKNPVIKPGPSGSWNDLRVLAPDVIVEGDGSLLMAAYGSSKKDIGRQAGFIGFWRSKK